MAHMHTPDLEPDAKRPQLHDMDEIRPGLWIGNLHAARNKRTLRARNIEYVLSLSSGGTQHDLRVDLPHESKWAGKKIRTRTLEDDFERLLVWVGDSSQERILGHLDACAEFIEEARHAGCGVLVHCHAGVSRSATVVAAFLMRIERLSLHAVMASVREHRPRVCPNPGFFRELRLLEHELGLNEFTQKKDGQSAPENDDGKDAEKKDGQSAASSKAAPENEEGEIDRQERSIEPERSNAAPENAEKKDGQSAASSKAAPWMRKPVFPPHHPQVPVATVHGLQSETFYARPLHRDEFPAHHAQARAPSLSVLAC